MVLVHGWALDLDMWRAQIELLSSRYRVIAFDRRGFGRSSGVPDIGQDVHDIERLLDCFDVARAAVVGMSQGARVALRWALKYPNRATCLVLDGPPAEDWADAHGAQEIPIDDYRGQVRDGGLDAFRRMWLKHPFMQLRTSAPCAHLLLQEIAVRYPGMDLLMSEPPQLTLLGERDLRRVHVPTLVLSGEHDSPRRRSIASRLAQSLPDAQLRIVSGAGHLAALDDPRAYVKALDGFFSGLPSMATGTVM